MGISASKNSEYCDYTSLRLLESATNNGMGESFREYNIQEMIEKARELKNSDFKESFSLYFRSLKIMKQIKNDNSKVYKDVVEFEIKGIGEKNDSIKGSSETVVDNNMRNASSLSFSTINNDNIKINRKIACIYNEIGDLCCIHDELEKSLFYFEKACSYDPAKLDYIYKKGVVYQQMDSEEKAITTFKRVLSINPNHIPTLFALGNLYRYIDNRVALSYFEAILKKEPDNTEVLSLVASCYDKLGCLNEAITYQNKAVQIDPENFNHKKFAQKLIETKMRK